MDGVAETADVVVRMITDTMPLVDDTLMQFGIFPGIVAYHEEGGLDAVLLQHVKNPGRGLGDGAVVEGQIDGLLVTVHSP